VYNNIQKFLVFFLQARPIYLHKIQNLTLAA